MKEILTKVVIFLKEVRLEIKKVNWPTKQQTVRYTIVVVGGSCSVAVFLGGLDFMFSTLLKEFIM